MGYASPVSVCAALHGFSITLILARFFLQISHKDEIDPSFVQQVWLLAFRAAGTPSNCRAASHLLEVILSSRLLSSTVLENEIDSMFSAVDLNGPALLCDSSLSLWTHLLLLNRSEAPNEYMQASERVLQWLFGRWSPCEFNPLISKF